MDTLAALELLRVLVVVGLRCRQADSCFVAHFRLEQRLDQKRATDLLSQHPFRAFTFLLQILLVLLRVIELALAKCPRGAAHLLHRNGNLSAQRFLIHQFFKDDHLQRAFSNVCFHALGKSVVLPGVGKNRVHLTQQVTVGQHRAIYLGHCLVADCWRGALHQPSGPSYGGLMRCYLRASQGCCHHYQHRGDQWESHNPSLLDFLEIGGGVTSPDRLSTIRKRW